MLIVAAMSLMLLTPQSVKEHHHPTPVEMVRADCFVDNGPGTAPANAPRAVSPVAKVEMMDGRVVMTPEMAEELLHKIRCLHFWPEATQLVLDHQAALHATELEEKDKEIDAVEAMASEVPIPDSDVTTWAVVTTGVVLLAVGAFAGWGIASATTGP